MTLSIATRGYLGQSGTRVVGPTLTGPIIASSEIVAPDLTGAKMVQEPGPTITGVGVLGPQIDGASAPPKTPAADAPTITGAGVLAPTIDSGKED
jgi:hypothetical protein